MSDITGCVIWFWRHKTLDYQLCDDEIDAAEGAYFMMEFGEGVPIGVQFPDGHTTELDNWAAYREVEHGHEAERAARGSQRPTPPETKTVLDPFYHRPVMVEVDTPTWVGIQTE